MTDDAIQPRSMVIEEFTPLVGEYFLANCDPEPVKIRLVEASPLRPNDLAPRPPFILIFHSPPEAQLLDGTYVMKCGAFGPDMISMSNVTPPQENEPGYYYQAVFN